MSFFTRRNASSTVRSPRQPRRLRAESLESRQMMAGDVTVDVAFDSSRGEYDLSIIGDDEANGIEVRRVGGDIVVSGVDVGGTPTLINNYDVEIRFPLQNEGIQRALDDIIIDMKDGDDVLRLINVDLEDRSGLPSLPYYAGTPNFVGIAGAEGLQRVSVQNMRISGSMEIDLSEGRLVANNIDLNNVDVGGYMKLKGGNSNDAISIRQSQIGGYLNVDTYGGHDVIDVNNLRLGYDISIDTGSGSDSVSLNRFTADDIYADLGRGDDALEISYSVVDEVELLGAAGNDDFLVRNMIATNLDIDGARGKDALRVRDTWIRNYLRLDGGQGSDVLELDNTSARDSDVIGGSGWDFLTLEGYDAATRARIAGTASSVTII